MQYTNINNISLPLAVFLATDNYDYEPNTISATSLLKPTRQYILSKRVPKEDMNLDVGSLVSSRMGSAIHIAIEQAWLNPEKALKLLGYPEDIIKRIKINPEKVNKNDIPVYMEQRSYKKLLGHTISGKFDFVAEGKVQDFKSTSVYTYLNQSNREKYILQGSIYRWLNPDIITKDVMSIQYIFTDWSKVASLKNPDYPSNRVITQNLPLQSLEATEEFIKQKLTQLDKYNDTPEPELPYCTDDDLWRKETVYKYYKNPKKRTRATKNFTSRKEAMIKLVEDGSIGIIEEVKGQVNACKYCNAFNLCTQKDKLIADGSLIL